MGKLQNKKKKTLSVKDKALAPAAPNAPKLPGEHGWRYFCRHDERGRAIIDEWHARLQPAAKANLERTLDQLKMRPCQDWSRPFASPIGNHIYVIRFKDHSSIPQRIFGHFDFPRAAFVMTVTAIEKDNVYIPGNCVDEAEKFQAKIAGNFDRFAKFCRCHNKVLAKSDRA